jgi:hypothetical protein
MRLTSVFNSDHLQVPIGTSLFLEGYIHGVPKKSGDHHVG